VYPRVFDPGVYDDVVEFGLREPPLYGQHPVVPSYFVKPENPAGDSEARDRNCGAPQICDNDSEPSHLTQVLHQMHNVIARSVMQHQVGHNDVEAPLPHWQVPYVTHDRRNTSFPTHAGRNSMVVKRG
jgi:hypothetical protein